MGENRFFNGRQKKTLYQLQNGKCKLCETQLKNGWHADHVTPYSKGGETTISNGQALCADCNLKKSNNMNKKTLTLRGWQERCFVKFIGMDKKVFSIGAVPGAGKSKVAAKIMQRLLNDDKIDVIYVVSPQGCKKTEWKEDFLDYLGVSLQTDYSSTKILKLKKHKGAVLTYAGINGNLYEDIQRTCKSHRVGVIGDEIHHLGEDDSSKWGTYFEQAFAEAKYKLFLSGTFWREDKQKIPFLTYNESRRCYDIDHVYTYSDSLNEGNSRKVEFEFFDPVVDYSDEMNDEFYNGNLSEIINDLSETTLNRIYSKLVKEKHKDLYDVIVAAIKKTNEIRTSDMPNAAMIVFAPDIATAETLQKWLNTEDFGFEKSVVVHSEDETSNEVIERFKKSNEKIIISINKISEGVDISRLRVGVYLSVIKTFLYFMQSIVGRLIRVTQEEYLAFQNKEMSSSKYSYAFLLKHPKLFEFSKVVTDDIHESELMQEMGGDGGDDLVGGTDVTRAPRLDFSSLTVDQIGNPEKIIDGVHVNSDVLMMLKESMEGLGLSANKKSLLVNRFANIIKGVVPSISQQQIEQPDPVVDLEALESVLHKEIDNYVRKVSSQVIKVLGLDFNRFGVVKKKINNYLTSRFGTSFDKNKTDVSIETLQNASNFIQDCYNENRSTRENVISFIRKINY